MNRFVTYFAHIRLRLSQRKHITVFACENLHSTPRFVRRLQTQKQKSQSTTPTFRHKPIFGRAAGVHCQQKGYASPSKEKHAFLGRILFMSGSRRKSRRICVFQCQFVFISQQRGRQQQSPYYEKYWFDSNQVRTQQPRFREANRRAIGHLWSAGLRQDVSSSLCAFGSRSVVCL